MSAPSSRAARSRRSTPPAPSTPTATSSSRAAASSRVGAGPAPDDRARRGAHASTARGCLATPGLVNMPPPPLPVGHPRPRPAGDAVRVADRRCTRSGRGIDDEIERAAARAGLAALARSGCTTSTDHHYVFPRDGGDLLEVEVDGRRGGRPALPPVPRLDGPRPLRRRAAARRGRRGPRRDARRQPRTRSTASTTRRPARCCGSRSRRARRSRSRAS